MRQEKAGPEKREIFKLNPPPTSGNKNLGELPQLAKTTKPVVAVNPSFRAPLTPC